MTNNSWLDFDGNVDHDADLTGILKEFLLLRHRTHRKNFE